jgi:hypothetical protein
MSNETETTVVEPQGTETVVEEKTQAAPETSDAAEQEETNWKAEARKWEARAKENYALANKWKEYEDSSKTEEQKRIEELEAYRKEAEVNKLEALRYKIATEKNIPTSALTLLEGTTEEELVAKADALAALISAQPKTPAPNQNQGKGNKDEVVSGSSLANFFEQNLFN